jgi:biopolymer transport protein ExbD
MRVLVAAAIFASACRSSTSPAPISCELVGDHVYALSTSKQLRYKVADICTDNHWSAPARACAATAPSIDKLRDCADDIGASADSLADAVRDQHRREADEAKRADEADDKRRGIKIDLPPASARADLDPAQQSLVVELAPGKTIVAGKEFADADLDNLFRAAYARDHAVQVVFRASRDLPYARVVQLMDRAKQAGLTHLALGTAPP